MARLGLIDSRSRSYPILFYAHRPAVSGRPLPSSDQRPPALRKKRTPPLALLARSRSGSPPPSPGSFSPPAAPASTSPNPSATGPRARPRLIHAAAPFSPKMRERLLPKPLRPAACSSPPSTTVFPGSSAPRPPRPAPDSSKPSPPRAAAPRPSPQLPAKPSRLPAFSAASRALLPVAWPVGVFFASPRKRGAIKRRVRPPVSGLRD